MQWPEFTPDIVQLERVTASTGTARPLLLTLVPVAVTACGKLTGSVAHTPVSLSPLLEL